MNAGIRETEESRKRRGKVGRQPSRAEQQQLFKTAMQHWERQGMQDGNKVGWREESPNGVQGQGTGEEPVVGVVPAEERK